MNRPVGGVHGLQKRGREAGAVAELGTVDRHGEEQVARDADGERGQVGGVGAPEGRSISDPSDPTRRRRVMRPVRGARGSTTGTGRESLCPYGSPETRNG